jgi:hypothetical protein
MIVSLSSNFAFFNYQFTNFKPVLFLHHKHKSMSLCMLLRISSCMILKFTSIRTDQETYWILCLPMSKLTVCCSISFYYDYKDSFSIKLFKLTDVKMIVLKFLFKPFRYITLIITFCQINLSRCRYFCFKGFSRKKYTVESERHWGDNLA